MKFMDQGLDESYLPVWMQVSPTSFVPYECAVRFPETYVHGAA